MSTLSRFVQLCERLDPNSDIYQNYCKKYYVQVQINKDYLKLTNKKARFRGFAID